MKKYIYAMGLSLLFAATSCDDQSTEITSIDYARSFSPYGMEAKVINQTNVRLQWKAASGANYTIEVYENAHAEESESGDVVLTPVFEGTPVKTITGVNASDLPYVVTGLQSETLYSVRVQTVNENTGKNSLWTSAAFETGSEQIFQAVQADDLKATEVTLRWPAGEEAATIVITPGDITHNVTAEEIAAGAATITGLTGETKYTARLLRANGKTRGVITFTTLVDLGGAISAYPGDDLKAVIEAAEAGATIVLMPAKDGNNTFSFKNEEDANYTLTLELTKDITIKGLYEDKRPTLNARFVLNGSNTLTIENIILKDETGGNNTITVNNSNGGDILIRNCEVTNYGTFLTESNDTQLGTINSFTIDNCIIHDMKASKRFVDYQKKKSFIAEFTMKNSTVYNSCASSDFIRFDRHATTGNVVNLINCTLYGVEATSKGVLYIRSNSVGSKEFTANVSKCLFANMSDKVFFSQDTKTDNLVFSNNYYFNAPSLMAIPEGGAGKVADASGTAIDPGFKDAANGDFTVSNETLIDKVIGDPRWLK